MKPKIQLKKVVVEFKSDIKYYNKEVIDKKNNTVRKVDWNDCRFHLLSLMAIERQYGFIEISLNDKNLKTLTKFTRRIRDISFYGQAVIITWEEK